VVSTRICGETSCNQILARFLLVKSPTKGPNVLKIPFREVTPITVRRTHPTPAMKRSRFISCAATNGWR
jgi:hypothetical protein